MDTEPELLRTQADLWRATSPSERAILADRLSADVTRLAVAGIRFRQPDASDADVVHELVRRRYGSSVACLLDSEPTAR